MKAFANNLLEELESGAFPEMLKQEAEVAGVAAAVATVEIQSVVVSEEVQVATKTNAAVSFLKTVSIPVQNFAEVDQDVIQLLVDSLSDLLRSIACVSMIIIIMEDTFTPLTRIACWMLIPAFEQPLDSSVTSCVVSFVNALTKSLSIGNSRRLSVSRLLSSQILSLSYAFDIDVDCPVAGCNVDSISEALQDAATRDLNAAIQSGQFMDTLSAETGNATAIISGEVTLDDSTCDYSQTTGGSTLSTALSSGNSSVWYPSWGSDDKCTNASGMPQYMRGQSHYHSSCECFCLDSVQIPILASFV